MENKTFALCYARVENSASKEIRSINLQLPLSLLLQDYIHLSFGLLFFSVLKVAFHFSTEVKYIHPSKVYGMSLCKGLHYFF